MNFIIAFQDGLYVFLEHWEVCSAVLVTLLITTWFAITLLHQLSPSKLCQPTIFCLGLGGGLLAWILISSITFLLLNLMKSPLLSGLVCGVFLIGLFLFTLWSNFRHKPILRIEPATVILMLIFTILIILRLSFVAEIELPLYTDGVEHYLIVRDLVNPQTAPQAFYTIDRLLVRYYHFGYHFIAGWTSALVGAPIDASMLIVGQVIQSIIPMIMFFPILHSTRSIIAGLFTTFLAALGWAMPAFASNWSKYPAITGLAGLLFLLSLCCISVSTKTLKGKWCFLILAGISACLTFLAHTRMIILFAVILISISLALGTSRLPKKFQVLLAAALLVCTGSLTYLLAMDPETSMVLLPYLWDGWMNSLVVLILLPFAIWVYPTVSVPVISSGLLILACLRIPLPSALTQYGYLSVLDGPFVQITIFFPLALIGGLGIAGLYKLVAEQEWRLSKPISILLVVILFTVVGLQVVTHASFNPSPCCNMVRKDDLTAFEWISTNIPEDSRILTSVQNTPYQRLYVDAAMWITPLTARATHPIAHDTNFASIETLEALCQKGVTHIYASSFPLSFRKEALEAMPLWYEAKLILEQTQVYSLIGCH